MNVRETYTKDDQWADSAIFAALWAKESDRAGDSVDWIARNTVAFAYAMEDTNQPPHYEH